jgi:hypothetical protein
LFIISLAGPLKLGDEAGFASLSGPQSEFVGASLRSFDRRVKGNEFRLFIVETQG